MRLLDPVQSIVFLLLVIPPAMAGVAGVDGSDVGSGTVPVVPAPCSLPEQFTVIEGAGPSCIDGETWFIRLDDGTVLETHGPDPLPTPAPGPAPGPGPSDEAGAPTVQQNQVAWREPARSAECVDDPTSQYHGRILYTHPKGTSNQLAGFKAEQIRLMFYLSNGLVRGSAEPFGFATSLKMHCSAPGVPSITSVELDTPAHSDSFSSVVNDLRAVGFDDSLAKYWIYHDDLVPCGCGGWANLWSDDSPWSSNQNHFGPSYAVTFRVTDALTFLHEATHNLGGVQNSSPNASGGWHCNDGYDIMCYADGGSTSSYRTSVCSRQVYDCNNDDYFHPAPQYGSYLAHHWNVASASNYLDVVPESWLPTAPQLFLAVPTSSTEITLSFDPPASPGFAPVDSYALYRGACMARAAGRGDLPTFIGMHSGTTIVDVPPEPGPWAYRVAAVTQLGEGALTDYAYGTLPGAPGAYHGRCVTLGSV